MYSAIEKADSYRSCSERSKGEDPQGNLSIDRGASLVIRAFADGLEASLHPSSLSASDPKPIPEFLTPDTTAFRRPFHFSHGRVILWRFKRTKQS